jgi:hypothetical protein
MELLSVRRKAAAAARSNGMRFIERGDEGGQLMRHGKLLALAIVSAVTIGIGVAIAAPKHANKTDEEQAAALGVPYTDFNLKTAHGLQRGCNACHGDHLAEDVGTLVVPRPAPAPELHGIFKTSYGIPMRVEDCLICHGNAFAGDMHSLHLHSAGFASLQGGCDSCHGMQNGKFVLYDDETRYSILNGVKKSPPTPPFSAP